MVSGGLANK